MSRCPSQDWDAYSAFEEQAADDAAFVDYAKGLEDALRKCERALTAETLSDSTRAQVDEAIAAARAALAKGQA